MTKDKVIDLIKWSINSVAKKSELGNPNSPLWNELYNKILIDWSWGLSKETKQKIKELI